jgi:hypothetical protein
VEKEPKIPKSENKPTENASATDKPNDLSETEAKVLEFLKSLDHPAITNEARDKFKFPLRANARKIFRKLQKLGYGELRKDGKSGRQYHFYVKGMTYPEPKTEQAKAETSAKA